MFLESCPNKFKAAWEIFKLNRHQPKVTNDANSSDIYNIFNRSVREIVQSLSADTGFYKLPVLLCDQLKNNGFCCS